MTKRQQFHYLVTGTKKKKKSKETHCINYRTKRGIFLALVFNFRYFSVPSKILHEAIKFRKFVLKQFSFSLPVKGAK